MTTAPIPLGAARFLHPRGHIIDGRVAAPVGGDTLPVEDPSTGEIFSHIPAGDAADIERAVRAARASFESGVWSRADPAHRGRVLAALARAIRDEADALAWLETRDSGKPIAEARADITGTAENRRSALQHSNPDMSGSPTSRITSRGDRSRIVASPVSPSPQRNTR